MSVTLVGAPVQRRAPRTRRDDRAVDAYVRRLGVDREPPSADALARLHRAHVERVPYETFWIHLAEGWGIDPDESMGRIARGGRGGYCFQLNGGFSALLARLGYVVTRHVAGVHDAEGPSVQTLANHAALIVHDLPTGANPSGRWYVDTGLGDALHGPLPLAAGVYAEGPMRYTMAESTDGVGDWHFGNDAAGSIAGVSIVSEAVGMEAFAARHVFNATSPESSFARTVTAQRRHATGVDIMRGCVLTHRDGATTSTVTFERRSAWLAALADVFGLRLPAPASAIGSLWSRVREAHEAWTAAIDAAAATLAVGAPA
ncbi:MAG TPA: arylamine N-acetyltransferase [Acidimicrobiales bacterium]|nr:arylamine N-acetyltransferase [Acidimicrobiales bacterium]